MSRRLKQQTPAVKTTVRCAIYTRKSTEDGLEQEYNSLDAQRDAGESYIASQKHEGWVCIPSTYDDGGFTGANMDRPALRRLMNDIEAGKVDCVVVYKVDRLSRSLLDFAKIMEAFDRHKVSFVSVTQAFNTGTSMGRLILNVLTSFAQFEREMISERTRDKIAAARRKGKWAGGMPVLGYTVRNTKLFVDRTEASRVQEIFQLYLTNRSALTVAQIANERGWTTKQWTTKNGQIRGGRPFNRDSIYQLLTNVVFIGKVRHKDEIHDGEHEAIIARETFDAVQALLKHNGQTGGRDIRNKHHAILKRKVYCAACNCPMNHSYSKKGSRLYRYYVCQRAQKGGWHLCPAPSLPAAEIENFVVDKIRSLGQNSATIRDTLKEVQRQATLQKEDLAREKQTLLRQIRGQYSQIGQLSANAQPGEPELLAAQESIRDAERRVTEIDEMLIRLDETTITEANVTEALEDFDQVWSKLKAGERSRIVDLIIERVTYDGRSNQLFITYQPAGIRCLAGNSFIHSDEDAA